MLLNLLSNAVKFSYRGTIEVSPVVYLKHDCEILSVQVKDEGVGIDSEAIDNLFKPFSILSGSNSHSMATNNGFGLSVCKQICQ